MDEALPVVLDDLPVTTREHVTSYQHDGAPPYTGYITAI
jgi:hypothetical protein